MKKEQDAFAVLKAHACEAEVLLKCLANAHRLLILCHVLKSEKTVTELVDIVGLSQSAVSQHLSKMKQEGLVKSEKRGQKVYYSMSHPKAEALLSTLYLMYCNG
jgi:DNA-binding transcriptional ArsR family regulator